MLNMYKFALTSQFLMSLLAQIFGVVLPPPLSSALAGRRPLMFADVMGDDPWSSTLQEADGAAPWSQMEN